MSTSFHIRKYCVLILFVTTLTILSCSKSESGSGSLGLIEVSLSGGSAFESEQTLGNRAVTSAESRIQRNTIDLPANLLMVAELRPEETIATLKDQSKAAIETSDLSAGIHYRLLVYNQAGNFLTERDYIRGQEANTQALELDGGSTYIFVAVSLGTAAALPPTLPADVATRTVDNSQISTTTGTTALMYYRQNMTVTGNTTNRLDILLKHRKPLIRVRIDATQTAQNITAVQGFFQPHNSGMLVNLSDGSHTQSGTAGSSPVVYGTGGLFTPSQTVINTSTNFINSANNSVTSFTISTITIGGVTATNLVPFTNLTVTAGVRYDLILNIVPGDALLTHQSRSAVRLNGQIWMRHNLGANLTLSPDAASFNPLIGDFYQWGRQVVATSGATGEAAIPGWNTASNFASNRWNLGTETSPVKNTAFDPCPTGFRVPTITEINALFAYASKSDIGDFTTTSPLNSAKVLTSPRNADAKLTFPFGGNRSFSNGARVARGSNGFFWSATGTNASGSNLGISQNTESVGNSNQAWGMTIKCIAQ